MNLQGSDRVANYQAMFQKAADRTLGTLLYLSYKRSSSLQVLVRFSAKTTMERKPQ